jgi:acetyltransferase
MIKLEYREIGLIQNYEKQLTALLKICVDDGASLGFLPSESIERFHDYWMDVAEKIVKQQTFLWLVLAEDQVVGTVQLVRATKANALHRAEIEKLMVHPDFRQKGIAMQLLILAEQKARELNLQLLVLDTRTGDVSEQLYIKSGFERVGHIPQFALSHNGVLNATTLFYKLL